MRQRKLHGIKGHDVAFAAIDPESPLSSALDLNRTGFLFLCGSLTEMSREYVEEPLSQGWQFARPYVHKYRSPMYERAGRVVGVKLLGESWMPDCENLLDAIPAWQALREEWERSTGLPLLSTPSKTGQALLWESLPKGVDFPALPDDVAEMVRNAGPQHRLETLQPGVEASCQYDGRWMYASLATLDRLPVGEPRQVSEFEPYKPGWYRVRATIPATWAHIGLLPVKDDERGGFDWAYPATPGRTFETWASEPELTIALSAGWEIEVIEGWRFERGKPLLNWARKLIEMRERLLVLSGFRRDSRRFAAAAIRQILNHTIGSFHANGYERETFIPENEWPEYVKANGWPRSFERVEGGRIAPVFVKYADRLSIYMPHWSAAIWALERARVAQWALKCDPATLVRINGDAIYATAELPFVDNGNLGQLRPKAITTEKGVLNG